MKAWEIEEIRRAVKGKWLARGKAGAGGRRFSGHVCTDSRKAAPGDLFVAIAGKTHDAHGFLEQVLTKNVAAVMVHREPAPQLLARATEADVSVLLVDDTVAALNRLAAAYRATMRAKVIAVGGSNGKTTTKRIIHTLLAEKFGAEGGHASPKSFNNNIGMPLTLLEVEPRHDYVVLEIGTNAPGEIAALGEVCRPDIAVITNVGLEHLEQLGDLEGVAREEACIAPFVADGGTLVLPADAPELLGVLKTAKAQKILVGRGEGNGDLAVTDLIESAGGLTFGVNGRGTFKLPLLGEHNASNALMAIAVARRLGLTDEQLIAGLAKVKPADMRLEPMTVGGWSIINDAYNANPSSMEAALKTFARLTAVGRKVVVLGDMLELGPSSDAMHRSVGGMVAAYRFDLFVAIGPHMRVAADAAMAGGSETAHFEDTAAACAAIADLLQPADSVLLKGSRGMALETLLNVLGKGLPLAAAKT